MMIPCFCPFPSKAMLERRFRAIDAAGHRHHLQQVRYHGSARVKIAGAVRATLAATAFVDKMRISDLIIVGGGAATDITKRTCPASSGSGKRLAVLDICSGWLAGSHRLIPPTRTTWSTVHRIRSSSLPTTISSCPNPFRWQYGQEESLQNMGIRSGGPGRKGLTRNSCRLKIGVVRSSRARQCVVKEIHGGEPQGHHGG